MDEELDIDKVEFEEDDLTVEDGEEEIQEPGNDDDDDDEVLDITAGKMAAPIQPPAKPVLRPTRSAPRPPRPQGILTPSRPPPPAQANLTKTSTPNKEDFSDVEGVLNTGGTDKLTRHLFAVYACNLPLRSSNLHDKMLRYLKSEMEEVVKNDYSIVYFHNGLNSKNKPTFNWLRRAYSSFSRDYKKSLKSLYIVHATMFVRTIITMMKPLISRKFGRKIVFIRTLKELEEHIHLDQLYIPDSVKAHDESLKVSTSRHQSTASQLAPTAKLFAVKLESVKESFMDEDTNVPVLILDAIERLRKDGLEVEGIFRRAANAVTLKQLKASINQGERLNFDEQADIHIPAVLIKMFLRELPEPLLTFAAYDDVIRVAAMHGDSEEKLNLTKKIINSLPPRHYALCKTLFLFFSEVVSHESANKMSASNMSIVIGPNMLWSRDFAASLGAMAQINTFTQYLINNTNAIFNSEQ